MGAQEEGCDGVSVLLVFLQRADTLIKRVWRPAQSKEVVNITHEFGSGQHLQIKFCTPKAPGEDNWHSAASLWSVGNAGKSVNENLTLLQSFTRLTSRDLALTKTFENAQPLKVPELFHPNAYLTFTS